jgi:hypothetical protein
MPAEIGAEAMRSIIARVKRRDRLAVLGELDDRGIEFITRRARHPGITKALATLPPSAWKPMALGRAGNKTRRIRVHDDPAAVLSAYPRPIRRLAITGLGVPGRRHPAGGICGDSRRSHCVDGPS